MRWLPIGGILVAIFAIVRIASQKGWAENAGAGSPQASPLPPAPNLLPETGAAVAAQAEPPPATPASSAWMRPLVGVSSPVPVVESPSSSPPNGSSAATEAKGAVAAISPAIPVAQTVPATNATVRANEAPAAAAAPAPTSNAKPIYPDTAPATAREDALLRAWPYPPIAPPATGTVRGTENSPGRTALSPPAPPQAISAPTGKDRDPLAGWGPPPAPSIDPRRFTEAHWQGIEVIPNTPLVAQALKIPPDAQGVIADDVTLPADLQGFQAGDLVTDVNGVPTPDLTSFIDATDRVRDLPRVELTILRGAQPMRMQLAGLRPRLGIANGETASMIPPGARMPHPYRGPCTNCHRIGTTGTLPIDQGDMMLTAAPKIRADDKRPHRDRGPCRACHQIVQ